MVCFSETKLQSAMYLGGFWSYQTMFQRNGGCWNAARTNFRHQLVKSLGTYMCWTQLQLGNTYVQVFNCYLHPGEQQNLKDRAKAHIKKTNEELDLKKQFPTEVTNFLDDVKKQIEDMKFKNRMWKNGKSNF